MSVLKLAARANVAHLLPTVLAVHFADKHESALEVTVDFIDAETLGASDVVQLILDNGQQIKGSQILQELQTFVPLSGEVSFSYMQECLDWCQKLSVLDYRALQAPLRQLDAFLTLRSYVLGHSLSLADVVLWGALRGNRVVMADMRYINVARWFHFMEATAPWMGDVVHELNENARREKVAASAAGASFEIGLPQDGAAHCTRFPPEPSGYLHIGHAKAALLNHFFAHNKPGGSLLCRFDDTNPSKESLEFEQSIQDDLTLLGVEIDRTSYSSDYFQQMYELCVRMIKEGKAFADDTDQKTMKEERWSEQEPGRYISLPSKCRDNSVQENLAHFEEMKSGSQEGLRWSIRAKISYDSENGALRDPVIYRCNLQPHHRTGSTWKMYPTYDFCAPILDSLEGITLALRTNEYRDRNAQYKWMQRALGLREVPIWDFARMNFTGTMLSKRKLTKLVAAGAVWGWDDPRMPTIRGIRRRGMTMPALREFILKQGPSRNVVLLDWTTIWATNKRYIEPIAPRFTAVVKENAVLATVDGLGEITTSEKPKHGKNPELGMKRVFYSSSIYLDQADAQMFREGEEITLMNWGNAFVKRIETSLSSQLVTSIYLSLHLEGDFKKTEKKVTWLADAPTNLVAVELADFDYLVTKDKIEKNEDFAAFLTPVTEFITQAWADCNVVGLAVDDIVQFERKGYFRVDTPVGVGGKPAVLFKIPTGKS